MNSTRYQNMMQYILPLMAVSSLISQTLVDFFLIICVGHWLYYFAKERNRKEFLPYTGLEWAFGGLFIAMLLSVLVNYWGQWEYLWPIHKIKWVFEFYAMLWFLRRYGFSAEKTVKTILWVGMIPSIYAISTYFNGSDYLYPGRPTAERVVGLVNSATYHAHASALLLAFVCTYFFSLTKDSVKKNIILLIPCMTFLVSFYLTYTRGAWIALLIGIIVFLFLSNRRLLLIFLATVVFSFTIAYSIGDSFKDRVQQTVDPEKIDGGRVGLLKAYLNVFQDNWLFGAGYDAYKRDGSIIPYAKKYDVAEQLRDSHAHNQYLQMLATTGILGFLPFIAILGFSLFNKFSTTFVGKSERSVYSKSIFSILIVAVFLMFTDQSFEYAKIRTVIVFILALRAFEIQKITEGA